MAKKTKKPSGKLRVKITPQNIQYNKLDGMAWVFKKDYGGIRFRFYPTKAQVRAIDQVTGPPYKKGVLLTIDRKQIKEGVTL